MAYIAELMAEDILKDLLNDNWVEYVQTPKPTFIVTNDPSNAISRIDLNTGDKVVIYGESEPIKLRGNVSYFDRIYGLGISIYTKESRQRLRDLYRTIRIICLMKKHKFTGWQFIRPISYQEMVMENLNIWRGDFRLQVENHAVIVETSL